MGGELVSKPLQEKGEERTTRVGKRGMAEVMARGKEIVKDC